MIEYNQSACPYIDFNTQLRTKATNEFEKDFFKLMNNAVFGKTMENIRKHRNIRLVMSRESYLHTILKPNCKMGKIKVVMKKLVYLGQAILDLSKIIMYEFHYDYMRPKFKDLQLCYMDTNSLIYCIKAEDFYTDIADDITTKFDTSSYCDHLCVGGAGASCPLLVGMNKKVTGLIKDELGGAIMTEFIALRPKLYSFRKLDGSEDKKC